MTENPSVRQRLLTRIGKIDDALKELGHLPADRLLVIDVDMTPEEHAEWQRRAVAHNMACEASSVAGRGFGGAALVVVW